MAVQVCMEWIPIYDTPNNETFWNLVEKIQYCAAYEFTDEIKGTTKIKLYKELGLESLRFRRSFRRLWTFFKTETC